MFAITDAAIVNLIGEYLWPMVRITAFFMAAPIFGTRMVSARIRLVLGIALTAIVAPLLPPMPVFSGISLSALLIVLQQSIIGMALGFIFQIVFQVFVLGGQYIAMKMGLGFASMNDPANGVSITIISQFYMLLTTLLFLNMNGHLILIQIVVDSFTVLPVGMTGLSFDDFWQIAELGGWMFGSALIISAPVLTALLVVNIAFGVMSRSAPQMNIFAVGFPITLLFGLLIMWVGFSSLLPMFMTVIDEGFNFSAKILQ